VRAIRWIVLLTMGLGALASAQARGEHGTWSFIIDNDMAFGTDQRYTNGVRLGWLAPAAERVGVADGGLSKHLRDALAPLPFVGLAGHRHSAAISLTQVMVTPDDIEATKLLPDQAPYFGYLGAGLTLYAWNETQYHALAISLGVVGPDSMADSVQRRVHRWAGVKEPQGWHNQVGGRLTADLSYLYGHRVWKQRWGAGQGSDLALNYDLTLGSPVTSAAISGVWRWGRNLPDSFNVYAVDGGGEGALLSLAERPARSGWFVYGGAAGTLLAYNTIERSTRETHNLSWRKWNASLLVGAAIYRGNWQVGLSLAADSSPVHQDDRPLSYGSLYLIWTP
jgi:lipid A 3-O-deacylase